MKKILRLAPALIALAAFTATPAFAEDATEPNVIQGSLTENHRGTKVTASYAPCGSSFDVGYDPYAQYIATIGKGQRSTATIWAHDIGDLNRTLLTFGYSLTQDQVDMFIATRASSACTMEGW
jgi:hypothetical protein